MRSAHTVRLLRRHTPLPDASGTTSAAQSRNRPSGSTAGTDETRAAAAGSRRPDHAPGHDALSSRPAPAGRRPDSDPPLLVALEGDPTVQEHLRQLVMLRPRQTMRETKRLLTLWGFYIRLLHRVMPDSATSNALGRAMF